MKTAVIVTQTSRWKLHFLEKHHFCFFLYGQPQRLNKNFWRFHEKIGRVVKTAFLILFSPYERFMRKNEIFLKNLLFISSGHGARNNGLSSFFLPLLCQNFILTVHTTILTAFFWKTYNCSFDFLTPDFLTEIRKLFLTVSKIETQVFHLLTKLFLLGSQYCFLLAHRMILMKKNSSEKNIKLF